MIIGVLDTNNFFYSFFSLSISFSYVCNKQSVIKFFYLQTLDQQHLVLEKHKINKLW